ncbi:MAG: von Willebrand factor type A domain-containing protein [Opitutaceae bacterium]|nr:von Willebrand factor type A domain-containing protein [Opitutaceae bacterium]
MNNFEQTRLNPDDPRLTAYALGELEDDERIRIEAAVAADPALQDAVIEIRITAGRLSAALEAEPLPQSVPLAHHEAYHTVRPARVFRFPYWGMAALAAAACLALVFALRELPQAQKNARQQAAALAGQTAAQSSEAEKGPAVAMQPPNHVEIQFPKVAENAPLLPVETTDQWGVVVPNPPQAAAVAAYDAAGATSSAGSMPTAIRQGQDFDVAMDKSRAHFEGGAAGETADKEVRLAPFVVDAPADMNYHATNTLAGTRSKTDLKDMLPAPEPVPVPPPSGSVVTTGGGQPFNTEAYDYVADNGFLAAAQHPLSIFSVDVDTASYSNVRRFLTGGRRPPRDAVRIEELVNYFTYGYAAPKPTDQDPFAASLEVAAAPWASTHRLVRIGLKGREIPIADRPAANLVFLIDVSGSMDEPNKLPLVQESLRMLVEKLKPGDRVAIVTYAGESGLALPSTPVSHRQEIFDALDRLDAGGSTNGGMGIQLAYDVAKANFIPSGVNRVVLATDGDFNVGVTSRGDLVRLIEEKAKSGVFLTALGVGMGNYKDATLEQLAGKGHGAYAYLDSVREARKVLAEQINGTLAVIARDVKVQVEFNPAQVQAYRLIGYEDRLLKPEDFNNDKIDAGDVGAGHTVTALYEVVPAGVEWRPESTVDELKYQSTAKQKTENGKRKAEELLTVKIRYQAPDGGASKLLEFPLTDQGGAFADASPDFKFAAAVAGFGLVLRDSPHKGTTTLDQVLHWAEQGTASDTGGYRAEFISLVKRAEEILPSQG